MKNKIKSSILNNKVGISLFVLFLSIVLLSFTLFSCQKETENFAITRNIYLHSVGCPASDSSSHTIEFVINNKTNSEILTEVKAHTFAKWVLPNDTIWFYKGQTDIGYKEFYHIYPDSVFERSIENACPYYCPTHW